MGEGEGDLIGQKNKQIHYLYGFVISAKDVNKTIKTRNCSGQVECSS